MELNEKFIEPIGYSKAAEYLKAIVDSPVFAQMDGHISGVFKAEKLTKWVGQKNVKGILFWFCNSGSSTIPTLAVQKIMKEYQDSSDWLASLLPNRPVVHIKGLRMVSDVIKKNYHYDIPLKDILNDIQNEDPLKVNAFYFRDSGNVDAMRDQFRSNYSTNVNFPFAYFSTAYGKGSPYFEQFLKQGDVPFIRYYLGYSKDSVFTGQQIRLILAPCKADGSNLKDNECTPKHLEKFNGAILLQNSWPPKPQILTE